MGPGHPEKEFRMKYWLTAALLCVLAIPASTFVQVNPATLVAQAPPPPVQKDGPFRLLVVARAHARQRQAQGFRTNIVAENGVWWVLFYP
jgi:hypothetical protein